MDLSEYSNRTLLHFYHLLAVLVGAGAATISGALDMMQPVEKECIGEDALKNLQEAFTSDAMSTALNRMGEMEREIIRRMEG